MSKLYMRKDSYTKQLRPYSQYDQAIYERICQRTGPDDVVQATIIKPRNIKFHQRFFMMVKTFYEIDGVSQHFASEHHLRTYLQIQAGHYTDMILSDGRLVYVPDSIAFDHLDQTEFETLVSHIIDHMLQTFVTQYTKGDIQRHINTIMEFA